MEEQSSIGSPQSSIGSPSAHHSFETLQSLIDIDRKNKLLKQEAYQALLEECEAISAAVVNETIGRNLSAKSIQRHARGHLTRRSLKSDAAHPKPFVKPSNSGKARSPSPRPTPRENRAATNLQKQPRGIAGRRECKFETLTSWMNGLYDRAASRSEDRKKAQESERPFVTPEKSRPPKIVRSATKKSEMSEDAACGVTKVQNVVERKRNLQKSKTKGSLEECAQFIQGVYRERLERRKSQETIQDETGSKSAEAPAAPVKLHKTTISYENRTTWKADLKKWWGSLMESFGVADEVEFKSKYPSYLQLTYDKNGDDVQSADMNDLSEDRFPITFEIRFPSKEHDKKRKKKHKKERRHRHEKDSSNLDSSALEQSELEVAATRIQAAQRRRNASKRADAHRQTKADAEARKAASKKIQNMKIDTAILEAAATRIQAAQRRKRASKDVEKQRQSRAEAQAREAAAIRIQAVQRRKKAAEEVEKQRQMKADAEACQRESEEDENHRKMKADAEAREAAATRIQAVQRRKKACNEVDSRRKLNSDVPARESAPEKVETQRQMKADADAREAAAIRIQAVQRRKKACSEVDKRRQLQSEIQARERAAVRIQAVQRRKKTCGEVDKRRQLQSEVQARELAAIKIQAVQRRKKACSEMDKRRQLQSEIQARETAAIKIQAVQRRKKALKEIEARRQLIAEAEAREAAATKLQSALRQKQACSIVEKRRRASAETQAREAAETKQQSAQQKKEAFEEVERARQLRLDMQTREVAAIRIQAAQRRKRAFGIARQMSADTEAREAAAIKIQKISRCSAARKEFKVKSTSREPLHGVDAKIDLDRDCGQVITSFEQAQREFGPFVPFGEPPLVREVSVQCASQNEERDAQVLLCSHWYQISNPSLCRLVRDGEAQTSWTAVSMFDMEFASRDESLDYQRLGRSCEMDVDIESSEDLTKTLKLESPDACNSCHATGKVGDCQSAPISRDARSFGGPWYPVSPNSPKINARPRALHAFTAAPLLYGAHPFGTRSPSKAGSNSAPSYQRAVSPKSAGSVDLRKSPEDVQIPPSARKKIATAFQIRRDFDPLWRRSNRRVGGTSVGKMQQGVSQGSGSAEIRIEDADSDPQVNSASSEIVFYENGEKQLLQECSESGIIAAIPDARQSSSQKSPRTFPTLASGPGRPYAGHCMRRASRLHVSQRPPWQEVVCGVAAGTGPLPKLPSRKDCVSKEL